LIAVFFIDYHSVNKKIDSSIHYYPVIIKKRQDELKAKITVAPKTVSVCVGGHRDCKVFQAKETSLRDNKEANG
jgi:hypothetical protein